MLSGQLDLVLGLGTRGRSGTRATRLAIDLKTGRRVARARRGHALLRARCSALRFGIPPYRVATLYLESGEWQAEDVDERVLDRAADRVIEAIRAAAASAAGRPGCAHARAVLHLVPALAHLSLERGAPDRLS